MGGGLLGGDPMPRPIRWARRRACATLPGWRRPPFCARATVRLPRRQRPCRRASPASEAERRRQPGSSAGEAARAARVESGQEDRRTMAIEGVGRAASRRTEMLEIARRAVVRDPVGALDILRRNYRSPVHVTGLALDVDLVRIDALAVHQPNRAGEDRSARSASGAPGRRLHGGGSTPCWYVSGGILAIAMKDFVHIRRSPLYWKQRRRRWRARSGRSSTAMIERAHAPTIESSRPWRRVRTRWTDR